MDDLYRGARPGIGHAALVALLDTGKLSAIITQNIDGLHQASGIPSERLIELHGNGTYATCLSCGQRHELAWVRERYESTGDPPVCPPCGGIVKSATISFGQAMPEEPMRRARVETLSCDLFIVVGSSLVVYPAAAFPVMAKRNGARLVIINREATEIDDLADLVVNDEIGEVLAPFVPRPQRPQPE